MLGLAAAAAQPSVVLTIAPSHQLVEGVATDGSTIFVSSVLDRQILACQKTCHTIATLPEPLHPLGIAWDWGRKLVWIAADCPGVEDRCVFGHGNRRKQSTNPGGPLATFRTENADGIADAANGVASLPPRPRL